MPNANQLSNLHPDQLLDDATTSEFLTIPKATLAVWRARKNVTLPYVKLGKNVRYRVRDLIDFIEQQTRDKAA